MLNQPKKKSWKTVCLPGLPVVPCLEQPLQVSDPRIPYVYTPSTTSENKKQAIHVQVAFCKSFCAFFSVIRKIKELLWSVSR